MSNQTERAIEMMRQASADGFASIQFRTDRLAPSEAADVIRHFPADDGLDPVKVANHIEKLPEVEGTAIQLTKTVNRAVMAASIPGAVSDVFEWVNAFLTALSAAGVKMNFGPTKSTDLKVFWGKPEVNTLIDIGGGD